jgi:hypothetical protein
MRSRKVGQSGFIRGTIRPWMSPNALAGQPGVRMVCAGERAEGLAVDDVRATLHGCGWRGGDGERQLRTLGSPG